MNLRANTKRFSEAAFSLVEVVVATAILGLMVAAFYGGVAGGFTIISVARENLRANQIVLEKMETLRLYTWDQVNSNGFIPAAFTAPFYPATGTNQSGGITFYGTVTITNVPVDMNYSNSVKLVRVSLLWTNNNVPRQRVVETLVSEYGVQNYVY